MKAIPFQIPSDQKSIRVQIDQGAKFYDYLHYHPEYQITLIRKGHGVLYVGNSFTQFGEGDVFLLGADIPHLFKNSESEMDQTHSVFAISIFFEQDSLGEGFFDLEECDSFRKFLPRMKTGLKLDSSKRLDELITLFSLIVDSSGLHKLSLFLSIIDLLSQADYVLVNPGFQEFFVDSGDRKRFNEIIAYSIENMSSPISLEEIARIAGLSVSQFSRQFKRQTRKTYIQFLNELRIESSCSQLGTSKVSIEQIAMDVGFRNLSNFNRKFKKIKGVSPSKYRKTTL